MDKDVTVIRGMKRALFFCKIAVLNPRHIATYRRLIRQQYWSRERIAELNWEKRKRLVASAYETVPYYRALFKSIGFEPGDLAVPDDFLKLPLLTKEAIRGNFDELISSRAKPRHMAVSTTGGSTGVPLKVLHDRRAPIHPAMWRTMAWWGVSPADDNARVWRVPAGIRWSSWFQNLIWWPTRILLLDAALMTEDAMNGFFRRFNRQRPAVLYGYVGGIDHLAQFAEEHALDVMSPRMVWVTSAPISAVQRERIERVFGAPVYDEYGSCEIMRLAAQGSAREALLMLEDIRHIEFLDGEGRPCADGQMGDIVVTDLENYVFPLIRYVNGDRGHSVAGDAEDGIGFPLMGPVKGRVSEAVSLPDGSLLTGEYLTTIFDEFPDCVKGFQVHQQADGSIDVIYIPSGDSSALEENVRVVQSRLLEVMASQVPVRFTAVDSIPHDRGKLRFVISDLASR